VIADVSYAVRDDGWFRPYYGKNDPYYNALAPP
jgi:hypothetical protein